MTSRSSECGEQFRRINLHWHDLRHEYASRLVERGVPLAQVRDLLGHASITTTERYDNQKLENLQAAATRLEDGKSFDPTAKKPASPTDCQVFVKSWAEGPLSDAPIERSQTGSKSRDDQELEDWLGGRDSEPLAAREARRGASRSPADQPTTEQSEEVGWEAGIRTPITCSRGRCPTVGRPPSTGRASPLAETLIIADRKQLRQAERRRGPAQAAPSPRTGPG